MSQQKEISVSTISTLIDTNNSFVSEILFDNNSPNIQPNKQEFKPSPNILRCEIPDLVKYRDTTKCLENELIVTLNEDSNISIDIDGKLLILHSDPEKFTLNEMGELIYNF